MNCHWGNNFSFSTNIPGKLQIWWRKTCTQSARNLDKNEQSRISLSNWLGWCWIAFIVGSHSEIDTKVMTVIIEATLFRQRVQYHVKDDVMRFSTTFPWTEKWPTLLIISYHITFDTFRMVFLFSMFTLSGFYLYSLFALNKTSWKNTNNPNILLFFSYCNKTKKIHKAQEWKRKTLADLCHKF